MQQASVYSENMDNYNQAESSELSSQARKFSTQQWMSYDVYDAVARAARSRPDYACAITKLKEADGMVYLKITFTVPGKIIFVQRLTSFIIVAMKEYYIRPM